jgi:3-methylfumaryl-CoA hydratase
MTKTSLPEDDFAVWIGRTRTVQDEITAFPWNALSATLDRDDPLAVSGTPVPPLWHWLVDADRKLTAGQY